jgi:hypothetical protein
MRFIILLSLACSAQALADDCSNLIALSRSTASYVADKGAVESNAANFCSSYRSARGESSSMNAGASYGPISGSFGSSNASSQEVASNYCDASNNYAAKSDAYKIYLDTIAPGAYDAYRACLDNSNAHIKFRLNAIVEKNLSVSVSTDYVPGAKPAEIEYQGVPGVQCHWDNSSRSTTDIETGRSSILLCERSDSSRDTFVTVMATTAPPLPPLTLLWGPYKDGVKVSALADTQAKVRELDRRLASLTEATRIAQGDSNSCNWPRGVYEFVCSAACTGHSTVVGGSCEMPNGTAGSSIALHESKIDQKGQWTCHYLNTKLPAEVPVPPTINVKATAMCVGNSK